MSPELVQIPAGVIVLRDDRLKRTWTVELQSFLIAAYPVTQKLYEAVVKNNPSTFKGIERPTETVSWLEVVNFCNCLSEQENLKPYYEISKENVKANGQASGYRLPTEAEWEYSCKAGVSEARYGELEEIAWYKANSEGKTQNVGQKKPNAWGLYDMLGNVWEWCDDIYDEDVYGTYRIFRGGGWNDEPRGCLATNRRRSNPTFKIDDLGFRVARNLDIVKSG